MKHALTVAVALAAAIGVAWLAVPWGAVGPGDSAIVALALAPPVLLAAALAARRARWDSNPRPPA